MAMAESRDIATVSNQQRDELLSELEKKLEKPMLVLSFVWLLLMIIDFSSGLSPFLQKLNDFIWALFVFDFAAKLIVAPHKGAFLRKNIFLAFALLVPALRLFRIFRAFKILQTTEAVRGLRMARFFSSTNRGIKALGKSLGRRGFGYILAMTLLVTFAGAAGMLAFEKGNGFITDYGTAVWWTAMLLTTMGSDYFPRTSEGRLLCLLLATYGFAIFGYVTASVATFFVGRDAENEDSELAGQKTLKEIQREIQALREELRTLSIASDK
jgi:voltage-gated potassium channel